jgi:hypothetical protein
MNNSFNNAFKKISDMLKGETSSELNELLNNFGVTKEDLLNKMGNVDQEDLLKKISQGEFDKTLKNLSAEDIEKLKKMNKDEIEELYKNFLKSKRGN